MDCALQHGNVKSMTVHEKEICQNWFGERILIKYKNQNVNQSLRFYFVIPKSIDGMVRNFQAAKTGRAIEH